MRFVAANSRSTSMMPFVEASREPPVVVCSQAGINVGRGAPRSSIDLHALPVAKSKIWASRSLYCLTSSVDSSSGDSRCRIEGDFRTFWRCLRCCDQARSSGGAKAIELSVRHKDCRLPSPHVQTRRQLVGILFASGEMRVASLFGSIERTLLHQEHRTEGSAGTQRNKNKHDPKACKQHGLVVQRRRDRGVAVGS